MSVLIIMPTYNERENLGAIVPEVRRHLPEADLLVIDDGSPDGTGQLADELAAKDSHIKVMHRAGKLGLGTAYVAGFKRALAEGYEYVFEMDADFSHDPRYLPELLKTVREDGADVAVGSRYVSGGGTRNWGIGRKIISRGGSLYARTILGVHIRDLTGGFQCFRRRVLESLDLDRVGSAGYSFQIEMKFRSLRKGFRVVEVPIVFVDRKVGKSKMSRQIFLEALARVWLLRLGVG
jgi:dolichol-phosphate mannosyltransferase